MGKKGGAKICCVYRQKFLWGSIPIFRARGLGFTGRCLFIQSQVQEGGALVPEVSRARQGVLNGSQELPKERLRRGSVLKVPLQWIVRLLVTNEEERLRMCVAHRIDLEEGRRHKEEVTSGQMVSGQVPQGRPGQVRKEVKQAQANQIKLGRVTQTGSCCKWYHYIHQVPYLATEYCTIQKSVGTCIYHKIPRTALLYK